MPNVVLKIIEQERKEKRNYSRMEKQNWSGNTIKSKVVNLTRKI